MPITRPAWSGSNRGRTEYSAPEIGVHGGGTPRLPGAVDADEADGAEEDGPVERAHEARVRDVDGTAVERQSATNRQRPGAEAGTDQGYTISPRGYHRYSSTSGNCRCP